MRVGEGLHKKIKSKNDKNIKKFYSKKGLEKEMEQIWKNLQKVIQKGCNN